MLLGVTTCCPTEGKHVTGLGYEGLGFRGYIGVIWE